jgi:hypothetical protein
MLLSSALGFLKWVFGMKGRGVLEIRETVVIVSVLLQLLDL